MALRTLKDPGLQEPEDLASAAAKHLSSLLDADGKIGPTLGNAGLGAKLRPQLINCLKNFVEITHTSI